MGFHEDEINYIGSRFEGIRDVRDVPMILMELEAEYNQKIHGGDHHGPGGHEDGIGGMSEMFDPSRMNQQMMDAIPAFMEQVQQQAMQFVEEANANDREITP